MQFILPPTSLSSSASLLSRPYLKERDGHFSKTTTTTTRTTTKTTKKTTKTRIRYKLAIKNPLEISNIKANGFKMKGSK